MFTKFATLTSTLVLSLGLPLMASANSHQTELNVLGNALESIIRKSPDVKSERLDQLPFREPIEVVSETGVYLQDYQWFKVRYSEGLEGYAWGGAICVEKKLSGILIGCDRVNLSSRVPSASQVVANAQSLFGSKVRSAPNVSAKQLFSIDQGKFMFVTEESGKFFDGWQWVKIRVSGESGYVWGGTICTLDNNLKGVHFGCE